MAQPDDTQLIDAGIAAAPLIADPKSWINRRVETIELLSREETRRRVSVDFTLSDEQLASLRIRDGIVVPISVLAKERRRAFDIRDEGGNAIPVLGRAQNGTLALIALSNAAAAALGPEVPREEFESLTADLRRIVLEPRTTAQQVRAEFAKKATVAGSAHAVVNVDPTCASMLDALWMNYVLFAVLENGGANRRVLKYAYGDGMDLSMAVAPADRWFGFDEIAHGLRYPDRRRFLIDCPGAWRATSFHAEVVIPEELRFDFAVLYDFASDQALGEAELRVNRAALYSSQSISLHQDVAAALEIAPEGPGRLDQATTTSVSCRHCCGLASPRAWTRIAPTQPSRSCWEERRSSPVSRRSSASIVSSAQSSRQRDFGCSSSPSLRCWHRRALRWRFQVLSR